MPSFMWLHGVSPYAPPDGGPVTTWIYGPLPFLAHLPATIATSSGGALMISGAINIGVTIATIAFICARWPVHGSDSVHRRFIAFFACLAVWPATSFEFLQADNLGVSFALLSLFFLETRERPYRRLLAASACVAALGCKQTFVAVALAEIAYIGTRESLKTAVHYTLLLILLSAAAWVAAAGCFGLRGFYFSTLVLPALLPWTNSIADRILQFGPQLAVNLLSPLIVMSLARRSTPEVRPAWLLPGMTFLFCWLFDLPAILKDGGSVNALHGLLLFMPPALVGLLNSRTISARLRNGILFGSIAAIAVRGLFHPPSPRLRPWTEHLRQGEFLARTLPSEIYFPWHPIVVYYAEHRFDHSEDGLFIRYMAGKPVAGAALHNHLPRQMHVVALLNNEVDWAIARSFIPPGTQPTTFRSWTLYSWELRTAK